MITVVGRPTVVSAETRGTILRVNMFVANIAFGQHFFWLLLNTVPKKASFVILFSFQKDVSW
jgi:hypothetical protein